MIQLAARIAAAAAVLAALGLALYASRRAADAHATATVARAAAEHRPAVRVDLGPLRARLDRADRAAAETRACADYLWIVTRQLVAAWPQRPTIPAPPPWCPMPLADGSGVLELGLPGERREWRGQIIAPPGGRP